MKPQHQPVVPPSSPSTKIGKGLLDKLRSKNKEVLSTPVEILPVTQEMIDQCKDAFINALSVEGKDLVRTQLMAAVCTKVSDDTINCECFNMLQQNTINSVKEEFGNYIIKQTNNPRIKVVTSLSEPEGVDNDRVLTKNEIFDELAAEYPQLHTLRATLGLAVMSTFPYEPSSEILQQVSKDSDQAVAALDDDFMEDDSSIDD